MTTAYWSPHMVTVALTAHWSPDAVPLYFCQTAQDSRYRIASRYRCIAITAPAPAPQATL
jgi:hypothetical protein